MKKGITYLSRQLVVFIIILAIAASADAQYSQKEYKTAEGGKRVTGTIKILQIHNLDDDRSLSPSEREFDVNIVLDKAPKTIFGFDIPSNLTKKSAIATAWLDLIRDAYIAQNTISIRYQSRTTNKKKLPPWAKILSVTCMKESYE